MALRVEVETLRRERNRLESTLVRLREEREELGSGEPADLEQAVRDAEHSRANAEQRLALAERAPRIAMRPSSAWISISSRVSPGSSAVSTNSAGVSYKSTGGVQPGASEPTSWPSCSWSASRSRSGSQRVNATPAS